MGEENDKPIVSVVSNNQSGGITAHTVNFGRQPAVLSDADIAHILAATPPTNIVKLIAVGGASALEMGQRLQNALVARGHRVNFISAGVFAPPPEQPVTMHHGPEHSEIILAPSA